MSQMIPPNQLENGDIFGMLLDDTSVFNLQILMGGLGHQNQHSTKAWLAMYGIRPVVQSRTWLFTGRTFRMQLERNFKEEPEDEAGEGLHQKAVRKKVPSASLARSRKRKRTKKVDQDDQDA